MTTTVVKTIGTGGDYTTVQAWEDAAPANLTTVDQIWQGQLFNQEFSVAGTVLTVSGTTTDATRYKHLTTYAGASFVDNANVQTNALRYNASNGAAMKCTAGYAGVIGGSENYFRASKIQASLTNGSGSNYAVFVNATNCWYDQCIIQSVKSVAPALGLRDGSRATNCAILYSGNTTAPSNGIVGLTRYSNELHGCTIVNVGGGRASSNVFNGGGYSGQIITNCVMANFQYTTGSSLANFTFTNCKSDVTTPPTGVGSITYDTSTGTGFQSITDGTHDMRIKSTSALVDAGTTDSSYAYDIAGTTRPSGSAYDVGCWELVQGGGGSFIAEANRLMLQAVNRAATY